MRIIVTGGAGFVGTNLIKRLLSEGHEVKSLDNYSTGKKENEQEGCTYYNLDINDKSLSFENIDVIFHMAALARIQPSLINPQQTIEANVNGTLNILELARKNNTPVIYAGSSSVHHGLYGSQYRNNEPLTITADGEQRRDFTHVNDIVDGLYRCIGRESKADIFELGSGRNYSINEVASLFKTKTKYIPARNGEYPFTLCDYSYAHQELGWKPKENLKNYIKGVLNEKPCREVFCNRSFTWY